METASKYKYQIAMETAEWNTSKQVSVKETVLWIVYKYLNFFFFLKQYECGEMKMRKWNEGIIRVIMVPV